jgi:hypothetical protein
VTLDTIHKAYSTKINYFTEFKMKSSTVLIFVCLSVVIVSGLPQQGKPEEEQPQEDALPGNIYSRL